MNLDGLSILEVIEIYKTISTSSRKDVFTPLDKYLRERISTGEVLENKELYRMPILVREIERVFSNKFRQKIKLISATKELIVFTKKTKTKDNKKASLEEIQEVKQKQVKFTNLNNEEMNLKKAIELCRDYHGIHDITCFNCLNNYLLKAASENSLLFYLENLSDFECLVSEIQKRFSNQKEKKRRLLNKITLQLNLLLKAKLEKSSDLSFDEAVQLSKKVNLTEEVDVYKYLSKYLSKRISNKEIFTNGELKIAEVLKEQLEADTRQDEKKKDRKKFYDKLRMLQFLTTIKSSLSSTDKLLDAKKVLVNKGRSSEFYIVAWDVVNELEKKKIDFCKLNFLLTKLIEESKKISKRVDNALLLSSLINCLEKIAASDRIININEDESLNNLIKALSVERDSRFKFSKESIRYADELEIRQSIKDGSIIINEEFPLPVLASIKLPHEQLEISNRTIIAIDDAYSLDLDGAFSILKDGDRYIFDVYITDVPSFLKENRRVSEEAYKRGTSLYFRNFDGSQTMIGMLPEILSNDYLSLLNNRPRNVLDFEFIFNDDGWLISTNVSRKQIRVTYNLTPGYVKNVLDDKQKDFLRVRNNLLLYKELMAKVVPHVSCKYLSSLRVESMYDFVAFPSVFTNYFITYKSQFLIYRDRGEYVKKPEGEPYSHSITPLRKFVSDINLAFFLNQEGIVSFDEKKLNFVEENIDEIIEHLNNQDRLNEFVDKNGYFVKKYMK